MMDFETLVQQPEARRDDAWEARFLDGILQTKVLLESDEPKTGPDGWPYLFVRVGAGVLSSNGGEPSGVAGEPFPRLVKWLAGRGIGLVVNAHKMVPDYVFTYGMLWNYLETGRFVVPQKAAPAGEFVFRSDERPVMGAPTEKYLPAYVREVLREFLRAQDFARAKILVISSADFSSTDLAFSLESLGGLSHKDQSALAEALSWFLPLHYNLAFVSEHGLPPFVEL